MQYYTPDFAQDFWTYSEVQDLFNHISASTSKRELLKVKDYIEGRLNLASYRGQFLIKNYPELANDDVNYAEVGKNIRQEKYFNHLGNKLGSLYFNWKDIKGHENSKNVLINFIKSCIITDLEYYHHEDSRIDKKYHSNLKEFPFIIEGELCIYNNTLGKYESVLKTNTIPYLKAFELPNSNACIVIEENNNVKHFNNCLEAYNYVDVS